MRAFRVVAAVEALTQLALLGAVARTRLFDGADLTASIGPVHGTAFVGYATLAVHVRERLGCSARRTAVVVLAAVVPAGGLVVSERLTRSVAVGAGVPGRPDPAVPTGGGAR